MNQILNQSLEVIVLISFFWSIHFMSKIRNSSKTNSPLTTDEKRIVILTELLSPVIAGAVYYYGWRKKFPLRANEANRLSWLLFGCIAIFYSLIYYLIRYYTLTH